MKNLRKKTVFAFASLAAIFMFSCGSTQNVEKNSEQTESQTAETEMSENQNEDSEKQNEVLQAEKSDENQEADVIENTTSKNEAKNPLAAVAEQNIPQNDLPKQSDEKNIKNEIQNEEKNEIEEEKIDVDELLSNNQNENAPTSDEAEKVSEPNVTEVFEEPEVIEVQDEPETEAPVPDENLAETEQENQNEKENSTSDSTRINTDALVREHKSQSLPYSARSEATYDNGFTQIESEAENQTLDDRQETLDLSRAKQDSDETALNQENQEKNEDISQTENLSVDSVDSVRDSETSEAEEAQIVPSRSVTIKRNQYLDVVYPGNGWVYLGENETQLLRYFGRRISGRNGNTTFTFRSSKAGNALLHFYKNDALTGNFIDDYLEVIVDDEVFRGNVRARAPDYAEIVPPKFEKRCENAEINQKTENESEKQNQNQDSTQISAEKNGFTQTESGTKQDSENQGNTASSQNQNSRSSSSDNVQTVISNTDSGTQKAQAQTQNHAQTETHSTQFYTQNPAETQENQNLAENVEAEPEVQVESEDSENAAQADESVLEKAKELFEEKKYAESLENVQNYINGASTRLDEAYYLLGQLYESNSSIKNIRNAVDAYDTVTKNYPLSKLWRNANQRSVYLRRFYIDIR